jgi:hypothetical protein
MKSQNPVLNPTLQGVLSCLDVQLEAELIRYRRQKAKARSQSANGQANPLAALDLKAFNGQPLREPITPGFAVGVPMRHPALDRSRVAAPIAESVRTPSPEAIPGGTEAHNSAQPTVKPKFVPLPTTPDVLGVQGSSHGTPISEVPVAEVSPIPELSPVVEQARVQPEEELEYLDHDDRYRSAFSEPKPWETSIESSPEKPLIQEVGHSEDNPYVIMTEPYTPTPVNWADLSIAVNALPVLEMPKAEVPDSPIALEETETVPESWGLPAELSEAELFALAGLSAAPLAIVSEEDREGAEKGWTDYEISDYDISDYDISDEDNPWPDELDEEPYALDTNFSGELSQGDAFGAEGEALEFAIDSELYQEIPIAIDSPLSDQETAGEPSLESTALPGADMTDPLMLPSAEQAAEYRSPSTPLVPPAVLPSYPGPHHLKPVGGRSQMLRPDTENYLASSEALLDTLDEEDDRQNWTQRFSNLFTPQGMGSALLLIFSALAVSIVLLNPELVSHWKVGRLGESDPEPATNTPPEVVIQESPVQGPNPNPYNLSSQEFLNLDLGNLSKVKPQTSPGVPSANPDITPLSPAPVNGVTPDPADSAASGSEMFSDLRDSITGSDNEDSTAASIQDAEPSRPRSVAPVAVPPPLSPPEPETPAPPAPSSARGSSPSSDTSGNTASPSSSPSNNAYVVVTPYTSDQLLDQSQAIVPDAYLRNTDQGANIQFGVFSDPASAEALAEQLQEQGIAVEVMPVDP